MKRGISITPTGCSKLVLARTSHRRKPLRHRRLNFLLDHALTPSSRVVHDGQVAVVEALVRDFYDVLWNRWDDASVDDLLADDFTFRGSLGTETHGRRQWRAYRDIIRAGSSDFHNEIVTLVADGDRAAARLRYTGTHTGHLAGLPPTGRRFEYAGAAFFEATSGRLGSAWVLGDLTGLRAQLGEA
jgi:steroid delta-isomerase-like uncharacterized protein